MSRRNRVPWIILIACWAASAVLLLVTRWYLARENAKRDLEKPDTSYDDVYVNIDQDGVTVTRKVDKACLSPHLLFDLLFLLFLAAVYTQIARDSRVS